MGKQIIAQRRGKGSPTYKAPSFNFRGEARIYEDGEVRVLDFISCRAHTAPLAVVEHEDATKSLMIAAEGMQSGDLVEISKDAELKIGSVMPLNSIPEGTMVFNIEAKPGDGGKFIRSSGTFGKVVSKSQKEIVVQLPSKKKKSFHGNCRATIGQVAGGGRVDKPLLKAGIAYFKHKARNHLYPKVSGSAMNAVDHPFGNKRSSRKSKAKPSPRNAPPGRKAGMIRPRSTGRQRGKRK